MKRLRHQKRTRRVRAGPYPHRRSPADVPDETDTGLVIFGPARSAYAAKGEPDLAVPMGRGSSSKTAEVGRGVHRKCAALPRGDSRRMEVVRDGVRFLMAWRSICDDADLELEPAQERQAQAKRAEFETAVDGRIAQAWVVALDPTEAGPGAPVEWSETRLSGDEPSLAVRMSKAMVREEKLISTLGPLRLRMAMDEGRLWRDADHLGTISFFRIACSIPLPPRLKNRKVLAEGSPGRPEFTCPHFAYAAGWRRRDFLACERAPAGCCPRLGSLACVRDRSGVCPASTGVAARLPL